MVRKRRMAEQSDYKQFWKDTELIPNSLPDTQLPILIDTLKKELDINKIDTILEVGVGYGRVAKVILDTFPNIGEYHGIDISDNAMEQCWKNLEGYQVFYGPAPRDFEEYSLPGFLFDLVISVETMSVVPHDIGHWIDKMISLSKKYIVNLDFTRGNDTITNTPPHDYTSTYASMDLIRFREIPIQNNESIFIGWVR